MQGPAVALVSFTPYRNSTWLQNTPRKPAAKGSPRDATTQQHSLSSGCWEAKLFHDPTTKSLRWCPPQPPALGDDAGNVLLPREAQAAVEVPRGGEQDGRGGDVAIEREHDGVASVFADVLGHVARPRKQQIVESNV